MRYFFIIVVSAILVYYPALAINENCTKDANCTANEKSVCLNNNCTCNELSYYLEKEQKCVKYSTEYGSICFEDKQCTDFLGNMSECNSLTNTCTCKTNLTWYQGECQETASKGEACSATDVICLDHSNPQSLTCSKSNICECNDSNGYYDRGNDCRLKSTLDGECAISLDCFPSCSILDLPIYSHCELGICVQNHTDTKELGDDCITDVYLFNSSLSYETQSPLTVVDEVCSTLPIANLTIEQCVSCPNTLLFKDLICICRQGFFLLDGVCVAELGVKDTSRNYTQDADCLIKPGKLVDGVCFCKDYWFQSENNRECKKTTLEFTRKCMDNDWCKAMGEYSFCDVDTEQCKCGAQTEFNETSFYCNLKKNANLTGLCLSNMDCPLYETCHNQQCECTDGFYRPNATSLCLPTIQSSCEVRDCRHINNSYCSSDEVCLCKSRYVTNNYMCVEPAVNIYDECLIEQQCEFVLHSSCLPDAKSSKNATNRCYCRDTYQDVNGECHAVKIPGSLCSSQKDCTIILGNSFVCRNMLCQCPIGQSLNEHNVCASATLLSCSTCILLVAVLFSLLNVWFS
ncbi:prion-like-(Q/N-rich) domain-bearing protein 25 [Euwallacea similis]|uniref:prion-like-(Q/N-rich) domain-bearing protein 25 n=1 Tax=Euwallacea similis TaxID=1736056 RepID=UPI0034501DB3